MRDGLLRRPAGSAMALAVFAMLVAAPGARADHVTASVSATATLGQAVKVWQREDGDDAAFPARGRKVVISWQSSCGPSAPPDAFEQADVSLVGIRADGSRYTFYGPYSEYSASGSTTYQVGPGTHFVAEVAVTCRAFVSGEPDHVGTASASSAELYVAPQVVAPRTQFPIRISCHRIPTSKLDVWLQAGDREFLKWNLWYGASILAPDVPDAKQIKLFARGAGINLRARSPNRYLLRRWHAIGLSFVPRRGGTLRIWATINGHQTGTARVKVLSRRC